MLDGPQLICDAVLPRYEPERHWLGVYAANSVDASSFACLDRFALKDANNEICWFSPTHDGTSLSWRVSVESDRLGQRRAQVLDYSASGMKLALDGVSDLRPGAPLVTHHHGAGWSYQATIAWTTQDDTETILGARLLEAACSLRQAC